PPPPPPPPPAPDAGAPAGPNEAPPPTAAAPAAAGPEVVEPTDPAGAGELAARAAQRDEYLALAQRTRADFENYRKRVARDAAAAETRAVGRLVRELLPAIDNLERALAAAGDPQGDQLVDGMRLVRADLLGALGRAGVAAFVPQGDRFDPELHEAIAQHVLAGATPGTVIEVYQSGYRLNETLIRPARVVVAGTPAPTPAGADASAGESGGG
ncbi:MAG: nucleotide exchange factor GrpE, partial [Solirubrobacteraceae bacterium]